MRLPPCLFASLVWLAVSASPAVPAAPIPVVFDTDIGGDIDDTWALSLLLRSPELDLRLVTTDHGNTRYRARVAARLLEAAGRSDVPVGIGLMQAGDEGGQSEWVRGYDLARYPGRVHEDGVQALIDTVMGSTEPVTVIAVGPAPTLAAALAREPRLAGRARFVGMYGSLRRGYDGKPEPEAEWNVKADAAAARAVLSAPWIEATVTPLDTCGVVQLRGERYARVRESRDPLARAVMDNFRLWCPRQDWCAGDPEHVAAKSSTLFDTVAVYLAFARDLVVTEDLGVRVTDDGMTVPDPKGRPIRWAVDWKDRAAFEELLVRRLIGEKAGAPR